MNFPSEKKENYTLVRTEVEKLDGTISPELKSEFVFINATGEKNIIVDMSHTRYCDSSGLSAILVGNRLCKTANGTFIVCGLQPTVNKLISISQLDTILKITPTLSEAVDLLFLEEIEKNLDEEEDEK